MSLDHLVVSARAAWHAEAVLAEIRMKSFLSRLGIVAFAGLISAFGLLMGELAIYFSLVQVWSAIVAAAVLATANFVIAIVIVFIAIKTEPTRQLALATELQKSALQGLQSDIAQVRENVRSSTTHPIEALAPLLIPVITTLVRLARKQRRSSTAE
jgi:hypothetical protein